MIGGTKLSGSVAYRMYIMCYRSLKFISPDGNPNGALMRTMKKTLLSFFMVGVLLAGCDSDNLDAPRKFFANNKIGNSPDFGIMKRGTDHVVTIHGFYDDLDVCQTLAAVLNRKEPNTYTCQPLNH